VKLRHRAGEEFGALHARLEDRALLGRGPPESLNRLSGEVDDGVDRAQAVLVDAAPFDVEEDRFTPVPGTLLPYHRNDRVATRRQKMPKRGAYESG